MAEPADGDLGAVLNASEESMDDMYTLKAEDEAVRFRTQVALDALANDLAEVRMVAVEESSLDDWRAEMKLKMDALSAELDKELEAHVPEPLFDQDWSSSNDNSESASGMIVVATTDSTRDAGSERGDVMAELARREATRAELLASLMR